MENTNIQSPISEPVSSPTPVSEPKTNNHKPIAIFSFFVLVLLACIVYLTYQNFQLRKQIVSYQESQNNPQSCQTCNAKSDQSCPKLTSCFIPLGATTGFCLPVLKMGQVYSEEQIIKMCGEYPNTTDSTANWKIYTNDGISFKYPSDWIQAPKQSSGSGWSVEITDTQKVYAITFSSFGNYNQQTGKPYTTVADFLGFPYQLKTVDMDGIQALQGLPRAGSENANAVYFFSKDAKSIYTLGFDTDRNKPDKIQDGQAIFDQILSTFEFINDQSKKCTQNEDPCDPQSCDYNLNQCNKI